MAVPYFLPSSVDVVVSGRAVVGLFGDVSIDDDEEVDDESSDKTGMIVDDFRCRTLPGRWG